MTILRRGEVLKAIDYEGHTIYIHKPSDIAYVRDLKDGKLVIGFPAEAFHEVKITTDLTAREFKREIQDNSSEQTGWLKITFDDKLRLYLNSKYIVALDGLYQIS